MIIRQGRCPRHRCGDQLIPGNLNRPRDALRAIDKNEGFIWQYSPQRTTDTGRREFADRVSIALGTLDTPFMPQKQKHSYADFAVHRNTCPLAD